MSRQVSQRLFVRRAMRACVSANGTKPMTVQDFITANAGAFAD